MRSLLSALAFLFCSLVPLAGQEGADAVIVEFEEEFTMNSAVSGTDKVHKTVKVLNKDGLSAATFIIFTDSFRSLGTFSAQVFLPDGKKQKLTRKDLSFNSVSSGLAEDSYAVFMEPVFNYPFTVTYDYTVEYSKGIIAFPVFHPLDMKKLGLISASYSLVIPKGTRISHYESCLDYTFESKGKKDVHRWTAGALAPVADEHLSVISPKSLPLLYAAPLEFSYGGAAGRQSSWNELGAWLSSLQADADGLPESVKVKVRELSSGAESTFETVKRLYGYLKDRTRYVSIQLGLGGYRPLPASHVAKTGFGDCKALSNYMKAMLGAAGVDSYYFAINTGAESFLDDVCTVTQMNHAMLAVPLQENGDTLFLECTNASYPLGYRHSGCAGHDILMLDGKGGEKLRIGAYPDSLRKKARSAEIAVREDGSASMTIKDVRFMDFSESFIDFASCGYDAQVEYLMRDWNLQPEKVRIERITDNFTDYPEYGRTFIPEAEVDFSMESRLYAGKNGNRLFLPLNPLAKTMYIQKGERRNRIVQDEAYTITDSFVISIPAGYKVESLPPNVALDTVWGSFSSVAVAEGSDGGSIRVNQTLVLRRFDEDKSEYASYKDFAKRVNKAYAAKIVLISSSGSTR